MLLECVAIAIAIAIGRADGVSRRVRPCSRTADLRMESLEACFGQAHFVLKLLGPPRLGLT